MGINEGLKIDSFGMSSRMSGTELFGELHGEIAKDQAFKVYNAIQCIIESSFLFLKNIYIVIRNSDEYLNLSVLLNGEELKKHLIAEHRIEPDEDLVCRYAEEEDSDTIQVNMRFYKG